MKILITVGVFVLALGGILLFFKPASTVSRSQNEILIGKEKLTIERADTNEKITLGLGERDKIGSDGMLFVLPGGKTIPTFWMKGMRFDLDFVWIDTDVVVDTTERVKAEPNIAPSQLRVYSPRVPVTHVLELPSGDISRRGIKVGDKVIF